MSTRFVVTLAFVSGLASPTAAQSVRGTLLRPDSTPAAGVIVVAARGVRDSVLARTMTNSNGRYAMDVPAGAVRLRALRIGHRPVLLGEFTLAAGATRETRSVLPNDPIVLMAVTTRTNTSCRQTGKEGLEVATVFEEARKALLSTTLTSSDGAPLARVSEYAQTRWLGAGSVSPLTLEFKEGESLKPFQSLSPDSLAKIGYKQSDPSAATYWAPDADVLLSESFAASHCMSLVAGTDEQAGWIGLTFRPQETKPRFVDVSGTLWLDQATNELRRLDFRYEGLSMDERRLGTGGGVEFTRLSSGTWFVSKWEIRMPVYAPPMRSRSRAIVLVKGGEVWRMRRGDDLLFTNGLEEPVSAPSMAAPSVAAPSVAAPSVAAVPANAAVPVEVRAARASCARAPEDTASGVVRGTVRDSLGAPLADASVMVEWQESHKVMRARSGSDIEWRTRRLTTVSWDDGTYTVCGVPNAQLLEVWAKSGAWESLKVALRIDKDSAAARVDLRIGGGTGRR